jgi:signal transduction histidine kinase
VPLRDESGQIDSALVVSYDITERKRAEATLQQAHDELERWVEQRTAALWASNQALQQEIAQRRDVEQARQAVLRQLLTAQEDERLRIARDLHDQLGQQITGLQLGLKQLERAAHGDTIQSLLAPLQALVSEMAKEVHRFAVALRPTALDDVGLVPALERLLADWSEQSGVEAAFQSVGLQQLRLALQLETALYRIVQEALNNVQKHSGAGAVAVILERRPDEVLLIVEDDGRGFDVAARLGSSTGRLGLVGMRERVALLGGALEIESAPGAGTTVFVRVPLPTVSPGADQLQ